MAIEIVSDPIMAFEDLATLLAIKEKVRTTLLINSLTAKFLAFTGRVQINSSYTVPIVEKVRCNDRSHRLWVHGSPIHVVNDVPEALALEAQVYVDGSEDDLFTLADGDLQVISSDDRSAAVELLGAQWPDTSGTTYIQLTYFGGWTAIPGPVIEGAVLQGRADLRRMDGEVGVETRSNQGESTKYDTKGIITPVRDLWMPYRVLT